MNQHCPQCGRKAEGAWLPPLSALSIDCRACGHRCLVIPQQAAEETPEAEVGFRYGPVTEK